MRLFGMGLVFHFTRVLFHDTQVLQAGVELKGSQDVKCFDMSYEYILRNCLIYDSLFCFA